MRQARAPVDVHRQHFCHSASSPLPVYIRAPHAAHELIELMKAGRHSCGKRAASPTVRLPWSTARACEMPRYEIEGGLPVTATSSQIVSWPPMPTCPPIMQR